MASAEADWKRMLFKGNKVWAAVDRQGDLALEDGKVRIKYRLAQDYEYRVHQRSLSPMDGPATTEPRQGKPAKTSANGGKTRRGQRQSGQPAASQNIPPNAIRIYTDGASTGNPGPSGIGALLSYRDQHREISEFIGITTNNVAELKAIQAGLEGVKKRALPVRLFTDSSYAYGLLELGWTARKNQALVASIRSLMAEFKDLKLIKVKGHAGHEGNERADFLATSAAKAGR